MRETAVKRISFYLEILMYEVYFMQPNIGFLFMPDAESYFLLLNETHSISISKPLEFFVRLKYEN